MKRIEIEVMRSSDALNAAIDTWHKAKAGKKVTPRLSFGSIKDLFSAITEKRLELLRYVAERQGTLIPVSWRRPWAGIIKTSTPMSARWKNWV